MGKPSPLSRDSHFPHTLIPVCVSFLGLGKHASMVCQSCVHRLRRLSSSRVNSLLARTGPFSAHTHFSPTLHILTTASALFYMSLICSYRVVPLLPPRQYVTPLSK